MLSSLLKYSHLRRRAYGIVFWSNREEAHRVPITLTHPQRPITKLRTRPLKPVILVTKCPRRQILEAHVVLDVRRRHHHPTRFRKLKQHPLEPRPPRLLQLIDP